MQWIPGLPRLTLQGHVRKRPRSRLADATFVLKLDSHHGISSLPAKRFEFNDSLHQNAPR